MNMFFRLTCTYRDLPGAPRIVNGAIPPVELEHLSMYLDAPVLEHTISGAGVLSGSLVMDFSGVPTVEIFMEAVERMRRSTSSWVPTVLETVTPDLVRTVTYLGP